jgi:dTDP-4-dehydrorhamnose reductase
VRGYVNAIYTGFPTQVLARIMGDMIVEYPSLSGLYHISSDPISKYDLLVRIRNTMGLDIEIEPHEDFYCDRSLDSSRFRVETGYPVPGWNEMIAELAQDDTPYDEWRKQYAAN